MVALDDPAKRSELLSAIGTLGTMVKAAKAVGLSRKTIGFYLKKNPKFAERIKAERMRHRQLAHNSPRVAAMVARPTPMTDHAEEFPRENEAGPIGDSPTLTRERYLATLEEVYGETEHPAWHHAARLLGAWHLEPAMVRRRKSAELEAEPVATATTRRVFISLPANGTEATPSAPFRGGVIDAEVVE